MFLMLSKHQQRVQCSPALRNRLHVAQRWWQSAQNQSDESTLSQDPQMTLPSLGSSCCGCCTGEEGGEGKRSIFAKRKVLGAE